MTKRSNRQCNHDQAGDAHDDECAPAGADHFLFAVLLLASSAEAPGAAPSSASGSLCSLAAACWAALLTSSRLARVTTEAINTMRKTTARLVRPMRMRCALLPAWYGIATQKLCPTSTICKATLLTGRAPVAQWRRL